MFLQLLLFATTASALPPVSKFEPTWQFNDCFNSITCCETAYADFIANYKKSFHGPGPPPQLVESYGVVTFPGEPSIFRYGCIDRRSAAIVRRERGLIKSPATFQTKCPPNHSVMIFHVLCENDSLYLCSVGECVSQERSPSLNSLMNNVYAQWRRATGGIKKQRECTQPVTLRGVPTVTYFAQAWTTINARNANRVYPDSQFVDAGLLSIEEVHGNGWVDEPDVHYVELHDLKEGHTYRACAESNEFQELLLHFAIITDEVKPHHS